MLSESNLIQTIASIGIRLGAAEDLTSLLCTILEESIRLTNCDGGSLYLLKDDHLEFEIVKNHDGKSAGVESNSWVADINKVKKTLNWYPKYKLKEGILKLINFRRGDEQ